MDHIPAAGVTSVNHPGGITGMAERTGQMQVYTSVDTRVVIYEAAHAQDYAAGIMDSHFTSTSSWQQVRFRTCNAVGGALLADASTVSVSDSSCTDLGCPSHKMMSAGSFRELLQRNPMECANWCSE